MEKNTHNVYITEGHPHQITKSIIHHPLGWTPQICKIQHKPKAINSIIQHHLLPTSMAQDSKYSIHLGHGNHEAELAGIKSALDLTIKFS